MSTAALTAKYRPQTFAEVAGQETLKAILSRAAQEDRVAPAYLFSGTRGVGKTTLARIFAKALNCRKAPAPEPCNDCDLCRAVTQGNAVDVVEIDGASNRGIDDVRRLKEVVGYAPMDGRYKIFIIDEAHMLSREAFNALLKTLEEPPAGVTFIMATTEPHKFPATIISRCQHFVFKRLPEAGLVLHLNGVLSREGLDFDESAVRLIARRGAGSVRDSMSLLGQVLALGQGKLTEEAARNVLGLAGQEAFLRLLIAFRDSDSLSLIANLREMLDQGLDMGFFLRELSSMWRNMFILRQSGRAAFSAVELPEAEAETLLEAAKGFSLTHIHACWQMTLEGQRRVLASLEPALALELLLLNLAMLPQLLSLESASSLVRKNVAQGSEGSSGGSSAAPSGNSSGGSSGGLTGGSRGNPGRTALGGTAGPLTQDQPSPEREQSRQAAPENTALPAPSREEPTDPEKAALLPAAAQECPAYAQESEASPIAVLAEPLAAQESEASPAAVPLSAQAEDFAPESEAPSPLPEASGSGLFPHPSWEEILEESIRQDAPPWFKPLAQRIAAAWKEDILVLAPQDAFTAQRIREPLSRDILDAALLQLCGKAPSLDILVPPSDKIDRDSLKKEIYEHPMVAEVQKSFDARIVDYGQMR